MARQVWMIAHELLAVRRMLEAAENELYERDPKNTDVAMWQKHSHSAATPEKVAELRAWADGLHEELQAIGKAQARQARKQTPLPRSVLDEILKG